MVPTRVTNQPKNDSHENIIRSSRISMSNFLIELQDIATTMQCRTNTRKEVDRNDAQKNGQYKYTISTNII